MTTINITKELDERCYAAEQRVKELETAIRNLIAVKGRHHTEQAYQQLIAVLGETK